MDLSVFCKIFISLSFRHYASFQTEFLPLCCSCKQPISALEEIIHTATQNTLNLTHTHLVLAVTAASYPPLTLSSRYANFPNVSTSPTNFSSCPAAFLIFPSHYLQATFIDNFAVTLFTRAHLLWIHLPHCSHKTELAISQVADPTWVNFTFRQIILCDVVDDHQLGPKVNFQTIDTKSLLLY